MRGGDGGVDNAGSAGGSITLRGVSNRSAGIFNAGSIDLSAISDSAGGSITSRGGGNEGTNGGSLDMSGGTGPGGSINTSNNGGSINTSAGGGSIDTRGVGSIQLGIDGSRTTLNGTASENRTIYLPNTNGTLTVDSYVVFTTGNQRISGNKTFVQDTTFGDSAQGDFLVISGNNFTVYGSGNFTSGLLVNGNPVFTGSPNSIVYTTGNQTISGVKTFIGNHNISGNTTVSGFINISGNYDLYSQIENTKKLAIAYAIAL